MTKTRKPERVQVNQRALVDKVLSRYPEDFTVLRELIQNADDVGATEVQIMFQTSDYDKLSAALNDDVNKINNTVPDITRIELSKWIVRNNGATFEDKDWNRLTTIGDGNPNPQKIGAFGVGFYSVFSVTESPKVISGGKSLLIFFDKNELYCTKGTCVDDKWTSIEMELKKDTRTSLPKPFDLARFLVTTMTFLSCLETSSVFFDGNIVFKVVKTGTKLSSISIPPDMKRARVGKTMIINSVSVATQKITVDMVNCPLVTAAGTKRSPGQNSNNDDVPNNIKFWILPESSGEDEVSKVIPSQLPKCTQATEYTMYSAEVTTNPNTSANLLESLKTLTKKDPPPDFKFQMVYFSKEEHDARAEEEKNNPTMGSVFRGPQGLFPKLDGDREYMSRVFIGQSTAQTTGIGGHLSGPFIPTVERGSIDLTNCHIAKWNKELIHVGGFLARIVYETEIDKFSNASLCEVASSSTDKALYVMRYFSFHPSTPDAKVSTILRDAFFNCSRSDHFPILSNSGIRPTMDVRQHDKDFDSFMTMPVVHPTEPGNPPSLIDILPERYEVKSYRFKDVVDAAEGRILQDKEMIGLLRWWVGLYDDASQAPKKEVRDELMKAVKLNIGSPKREVALSSILKFIDSFWLPLLQLDDALPPDTIPFLFTRNLEEKLLSARFWEPMTIADWLRHLISADVDSAHNICKNESYSHRVLTVLGNLWLALPNDDPMKHEAKELMKDIPWIVTNKGFRKASEAYFDEVDIFGDIPVVTANPSEPLVLTVLTDFGVQNFRDLGELLAEAAKLDLWPTHKMIRYLGKMKKSINLEDIQNRDIFISEKGEKSCINALCIPRKDIRQLGFPILSWHGAISPNDEQILTWLGFLKHPPLEDIIKIAGSNDLRTRCAAFKYLSDNFDEVYEEEYEPSKLEGFDFIPAVKNGAECVGAHKDVYSDPSWAEMGFMKVHDSVDSKMKSRLEIQEDPSAEQIIQIFNEKRPKDRNMAIKWFETLAKKQVLSPDHLQQLAELPIVPIEGPISHDGSIRLVFRRPLECFLDVGQYHKDHHYQRIFTFQFVDFGEHANNFLKACGAKTKPDCSDIVNMLLENPSDFLEKMHTDREQDPEKYLDELRLIAIGYDKLSEEHKQMVKEAQIFVSRRASGPGANQGITYNKSLLTPSNILIASGLENHRTFQQHVWLAPQEEILERLYESVGSKYLSDCIIYNVEPGKEITRPDCEEVRKTILARLPIFLHGLDGRLKNPSVHLLWNDRSNFLVKGCEDLKVEMRLETDSYTLPPEKCTTSAEITKDDTPITLWLTGIEMYDIAAALCRLLVKTPKKHDVLCLMTILKTDKEVLKRRGYNIDASLDKEAKKFDDQKDERDKEESQVNMASSVPPNDEQCTCCIPFPRFPKLCNFLSNGVKTKWTVKGGEINDLIDETLAKLSKGEATPDEQDEQDRNYRGTGKKVTDVGYCDTRTYTDLVRQPEDDSMASIKIWKQKTVEEEIPPEDLKVFVTIIGELRGVFGLSGTNAFNIFWHPDDPELMGFNRDGSIFLNLAHYISKHVRQPSGMAYIEWYYIIAHEMAHVRTPFHDEHHELLLSSLIVYFFKSLHEVKHVPKYLGCTPASTQ